MKFPVLPSPAAALILLLAGPAVADSRTDWTGYDWRPIKLSECSDFGAATACHFFHGKWDWKRNQWVDLVMSVSGATLEIEQILTNYDRADDDYVCTVVLLQDADGNNVVPFHFNEHSDHQTASTSIRRFSVTSSILAAVSQISVGTKQCRDGASQDKANFARVVNALQAR